MKKYGHWYFLSSGAATGWIEAVNDSVIISVSQWLNLRLFCRISSARDKRARSRGRQLTHQAYR